MLFELNIQSLNEWTMQPKKVVEIELMKVIVVQVDSIRIY